MPEQGNHVITKTSRIKKHQGSHNNNRTTKTTQPKTDDSQRPFLTQRRFSQFP